MSEGISEAFDISRGFLTSYGYYAIFALMVLETALFIGAFVPGVIVLVLSGYAASAGVLSPPSVFIAAVSGVILGDNASYVFGRFFGERYLNFPNNIHAAAKRNRWFLLFFHHVPLSRMFIPAFFGMNRTMQFRVWVIFEAASALIFVITYFSIGYAAHVYRKNVDALYENINLYILGICVALLAVWLLKIYRDRT